MASFMSYFGAGRKDPKETARDAIVGLRQQLQMIEKKEEYLQKKIDEEVKKAKANVVSNKAGEFRLCFQPRVLRRPYSGSDRGWLKAREAMCG